MENIKYIEDNMKLTGENIRLRAENTELKKYSDELKTYIENLFQIKKKISKIYILTTVMFFCLVGISVIVLLIKISIVIKIIWFMLLVPLFLFNALILIIKLYRDKHKIVNFLIGKLSRNYIVAFFFMENRRILKKLIRTSDNNFNFDNGIYLLSEESMYLDLDKNPTIFYKYGIPNPLKFNFLSYVDKYLNTEDKTSIKDKLGDILDLSYSSTTLKKYKDDKIFDELHSKPFMESNLLVIIILVFALIIILVLIFRK